MAAVAAAVDGATVEEETVEEEAVARAVAAAVAGVARAVEGPEAASRAEAEDSVAGRRAPRVGTPVVEARAATAG